MSVVGGSGGSCGSRRIEPLATGRNAPDLASAFRHAHAQHVGSSDAGLGWVNPVSSVSEKVQSHAVGWKIPIVLQYRYLCKIVPPVFTQGCVVGLLGGRYM